MKRATSCSSKEKEERYADHGYQIEREEKDEFCDLAEGEGGIDC